nr:immunoglobulin light chain junction region [Macaca mulatta]
DYYCQTWTTGIVLF